MTSSLHELLENSNYPEALKLINSNLKDFGINEQLISLKIFCLINMQKFTLALSTIKMTGKDLASPKNSFSFEKAYCLYRLGKFEACLNQIEASKLDSRMNLLKGQVLYRLEKFEEAAKIFESLSSSNKFPSEELQINLLAAKSQAGIDSNETELNSFDAYYNMALLKLNIGDFKTAENLSEVAKDFAVGECASPSDSINCQLLSICTLMTKKDNWPEAEFLLRKLKTSKGLTTMQETLINANLMAIADKSSKENNYSDEFIASSIEKQSLFDSQKQQVLANAHHYGVQLTKSQIKSISTEQEFENDTTTIRTIDSLKKDAKYTKNVCKPRKDNLIEKKNSQSPLDKERWLPLRDRSYYKPKVKYLKSVKKTSHK